MEGIHWQNIKTNYEAQPYKNYCIVGPGTSTHLRSWLLSISQNTRKVILPLYISPSYQQKISPKEKSSGVFFVLPYHEENKTKLHRFLKSKKGRVDGSIK